MIYFIINPTAGGGKSVEKIEEIERSMSGEYRILQTQGPMDAKYLAQEAVCNGAEAIIAVGGDGTVHEVISGMVGADIPLGVIAAGSGNDFVKSLGSKQSFNTAKYINIIKRNKPQAIDILQMGGFYFANIGSVGLDAEIVKTAVGLKPRFGKAAYIAATIKNTLTFGGVELSFNVDGVKHKGSYTLMAICNGKYYGGGYRIAPSAKIDDGLMTICLIEKLPKAALTLLFPAVLAGVHTNLKQVRIINCKELTVSYEGMRLVNLDGNLYELKAPLQFRAIEGGLKIFK